MEQVKMRSPYTLEIDDRVRLTRKTILHKEGSLGTVTEKFTPSHATGCWSITVRFDDCTTETCFDYPGAPLQRSTEGE